MNMELRTQWGSSPTKAKIDWTPTPMAPLMTSTPNGIVVISPTPMCQPLPWKGSRHVPNP